MGKGVGSCVVTRDVARIQNLCWCSAGRTGPHGPTLPWPCEGVESRSPAPGACLFSALECRAAERWQFVGKQTPGPGGAAWRPACPARAWRARPRRVPRAWHAATAATAPHHPQCSLPLPPGAPVWLRHHSSCRPLRLLEGICCLGFACTEPRLSWHSAQTVASHELGQNVVVGVNLI